MAPPCPSDIAGPSGGAEVNGPETSERTPSLTQETHARTFRLTRRRFGGGADA
jgi:hypothetical protein